MFRQKRKGLRDKHGKDKHDTSRDCFDEKERDTQTREKQDRQYCFDRKERDFETKTGKQREGNLETVGDLEAIKRMKDKHEVGRRMSH